MAADAGRERPDIILIGSLPESQTAAVEQLAACAALGATDYIQASRYDAESGFDAIIARLEDLRRQLG
jgi:hypothetical protein